MQKELTTLLRKVQQAGLRAADEFAEEAFRLGVQSGVIVLEGTVDVVQRSERTTKAYLRLQARELLSGQHQQSEWLHVKSQWSSQAFIGAVIAHAQALGFIANIFRAAIGVFGGAGNFVAKAGIETVGNLLKRIE